MTWRLRSLLAAVRAERGFAARFDRGLAAEGRRDGAAFFLFDVVARAAERFVFFIGGLLQI
jgi:hypothetical protein